jgi:hypothetical protein
MDELLQRLIAISEEQLRWQKAAVMPQVRRTIEESLSKTTWRKAYELFDGSRTYEQVGKEIGGTGKSTVASWTRRWRDLGIAYEDSNGRIVHLASLESLGIPLEVHGE